MNQQLTKTKKSDIQRAWHLIDVKDKVLGRISTEIASILRGKAKPYFVNHLDCGDYVVVINAKQVKLTGSKEEHKIYTYYSGYPGGKRTTTPARLRATKPEEIINRAVSGMMPKNKLNKIWMTRLYVYPEETHPYTDKFKTVQSA